MGQFLRSSRKTGEREQLGARRPERVQIRKIFERQNERTWNGGGWDLGSSDQQVWVVYWGRESLVHSPDRTKEAKYGVSV